MLATLHAAWDSARTHIAAAGDGVLASNGFYSVVGDGGLRLSAWNANNHQLTWGVFGAALLALMDYMRTEQWYGSVSFDIYDGLNMVATAYLA